MKKLLFLSLNVVILTVATIHSAGGALLKKKLPTPLLQHPTSQAFQGDTHELWYG